MKITNQRMERPKAVPLAALLVNQARHARRFKNRVTECTGKGQGEKRGLTQGGRRPGCPQSKPLPRKPFRPAVREAANTGRDFSLYLGKIGFQILVLWDLTPGTKLS